MEFFYFRKCIPRRKDQEMRFFIVTLFLSALPITAMSQQSPTPASYPLSHWSPTGSANEYAPDISPALEAKLKHTFLPSAFPEIKTLMDFRSIHPAEAPEWNTTTQQHLYFAPLFQQNPLFETPKMLLLPETSNGILIPDSSGPLKWEPR